MITHHELCFGCGQANLFGLQLEVEPDGDGGVAGRFFVKQDHQGPPGFAHGGIVATALDETMALLVHEEGTMALTARLEIELRAPVPIGSFALLRAWVAERAEQRLELRAELRSEADPARLAARGLGTFVRLADSQNLG